MEKGKEGGREGTEGGREEGRESRLQEITEVLQYSIYISSCKAKKVNSISRRNKFHKGQPMPLSKEAPASERLQCLRRLQAQRDSRAKEAPTPKQ